MKLNNFSKAKKISFDYVATADGVDIDPLISEGYFTIPGEPTDQQINDKLAERISAEFNSYLASKGIDSEIKMSAKTNFEVSDVAMNIELKF